MCVEIVSHLDLPDEFLGLGVVLVLPECALDVGEYLADEPSDMGGVLASLVDLALELLLRLVQQLQQLEVLRLQTPHAVSVRLRRLRGAQILILLRVVLDRLLLVKGRMRIP